MEDLGAEVQTPEGETPDETPVPHPWPLAYGVGLLEGTLVGAVGAGRHAYALVLRDGRRFEVSEPLYRLAELLQGRLSAEEIAARLSARLGRPLSVADVAGLVELKLAPQGVVRTNGE
jgi:hypothetical protein